MSQRSKRTFGALASSALIALLALSLFGVAHRAGAQEGTPQAVSNQTPGTISVDGTGTVLVTPDTASITVGVSTSSTTLADAQSQATTQMTAIINELKAQGIDEKDIQTSNYSVNIVQNYDNKGNPGEITGFQVSNQVTVTVRNLDKVGTILDAVVAKGANTIYGINFFVADPSQAQAQARKLAVQNAIDQAKELADAAGVKVGRILSISSGAVSSPSPVPYGMGVAADKASVPVQAGTSAISIDVQVTFEIAQ